MHVEIFRGGFFATRDGFADFRAEDFRAAAGERVQAGFVEFGEDFRDGFLGQPGEVQDFNGGETFELQADIDCFQRPQHVV